MKILNKFFGIENKPKYEVGTKIVRKDNFRDVYTINACRKVDNSYYYDIANVEFSFDKKTLIEYEIERYYCIG